MKSDTSVRTLIDHAICSDGLNYGDTHGEKEVYRIGDIASEFNVTLRTLRFYEDRGMISPQRSGMTRLYSRRDRARIRAILIAKGVGFSLVDIQDLLEIYDKNEQDRELVCVVRRKCLAQLEKLEQQKAETERSIADLNTILLSVKDLFSTKGCD